MSYSNAIIDVLIDRDGYSKSEAIAALKEARLMINAGMDPEEVLMTEFNLEPDYLYDLIQ